jgi:hypothetical protein
MPASIEPALRGQVVLRELLVGPVCASELGAILGVPMRNCSAWLGLFRTQGIVEVVGTVRHGHRLSFLYALTPLGVRKVAAKSAD